MATTAQQATLDRQFVEDFARRYDEAWESGDGARVAELCAEDVVWVDPALPEALRGRDAVRGFVEATYRMVPDVRFEMPEPPYTAPSGSRVIVPYRMSGTMTGPWEYMDLAPTGRRFEVDGIDVWDMRDGVIAHYRTLYDSMDMSRQIGVLPEQGSGAERVLGRLQHVQARFQRRSGG
jgi:steroid delta-isomerase-like uncharacterized protein